MKPHRPLFVVLVVGKAQREKLQMFELQPFTGEFSQFSEASHTKHQKACLIMIA
jgi:hypothetical protein